jgi:hypothetical protein
VLVDAGEVAAFANHPGVIGRDDLGADRPLHGLTDVLQVLPVVASLFRHQRRIGGDTVEDAERGERLDLLQVPCINKELHGNTSFSFVIRDS